MLKNLRLKILAFVIGIIFWAGVISLNNNVRTYNGHLEIKPFNVEGNLLVANEFEPVHLRIAASNDVFTNLSEKDFNLYVDLKGLSEGEHLVPVSVTAQNPKISIARISPASIKVILEPQNEKKVPVAIQVKGEPAKNFIIKESKIGINEVKIAGPQSLLDQASRAIAMVQLSGEENVDIIKKIPLIVVDSNENPLPRLKPEIPDVELKMTLTQVLKTKTVGVRANLINDLPDNNLWVKKVSISPPTLVIKGDYPLLQNIDSLETEKIDLSQIKSNLLRRFQVILPDQIEIDGDTKTVLIKIEVGEEKIKIKP